jgi:hypothetical protein
MKNPREIEADLAVLEAMTREWLRRARELAKRCKKRPKLWKYDPTRF